jgi:hypothetical protein
MCFYFSLHWVNDLPRALEQVRRLLLVCSVIVYHHRLTNVSVFIVPKSDREWSEAKYL